VHCSILQQRYQYVVVQKSFLRWLGLPGGVGGSWNEARVLWDRVEDREEEEGMIGGGLRRR